MINSEQSSGHAYCMSSGEQGSLFVGQFSPRKIFSETVDHFSGEFSSFLFKQKLFKSLFSCLGEKSGLNIFIQFGCLDLADKRELWRHLRSVRGLRLNMSTNAFYCFVRSSKMTQLEH